MSKNNPNAEVQTAPNTLQEEPRVEAQQPQQPPVIPPRETARKGGVMATYTRIYPKVYGGICEKCGVLDRNQDSEVQYKLCEHYRGMSLECNYCEPTKDQTEVTRISKLYIYDHPTMKDSYGRPTLGVVCDSFNCQNKFNEEFGK